MLTTENVISLNLRSSYLNINITVATASNYILFWFLGYFQKTSQHDDSHSVSTFNHRSWKEREDSELIALLNIYLKFIFLIQILLININPINSKMLRKMMTVLVFWRIYMRPAHLEYRHMVFLPGLSLHHQTFDRVVG